MEPVFEGSNPFGHPYIYKYEMYYRTDENEIKREQAKLILRCGRACESCGRFKVNYYCLLKTFDGEDYVDCVFGDMPKEKMCGYWILSECITYQKRVK